jgi:hypothetical protein
MSSLPCAHAESTESSNLVVIATEDGSKKMILQPVGITNQFEILFVNWAVRGQQHPLILCEADEFYFNSICNQNNIVIVGCHRDFCCEFCITETPNIYGIGFIPRSVTFTRVDGQPEKLSGITVEDMGVIASLCDKVVCKNLDDATKICIRETSGKKQVTFSSNDNTTAEEVVIIRVENDDQDRHSAHMEYVHTLFKLGIGPKCFGSQIFRRHSYYFTEKIGTCTTLSDFLTKVQNGAIPTRARRKCSEGLLTFLSLMMDWNRQDTQQGFNYIGNDWYKFTNDCLVDVQSGRLFIWTVDDVATWKKKCPDCIYLGIVPCSQSVEKVRVVTNLLRMVHQVLEVLLC